MNNFGENVRSTAYENVLLKEDVQAYFDREAKLHIFGAWKEDRMILISGAVTGRIDAGDTLADSVARQTSHHRE